MSNLLKNYYIGEPEGRYVKRGQDKNGNVHCLLWLMIYKKGVFFAKPNEYSLGCSGSGIGKSKTLAEAREELHDFATNDLALKKQKAINELERIQNALDMLGDDPANIEQFTGKYKETKY